MTVREVMDRLSVFDPDQEIIFYNLENYDLQNRKLETIIETDGRIEFTIQKWESEQ
tara:strand:+ start:117 stop:284 length:168 start_codon:yes stop_codon:yes gene_type:complete